MNHSDERLDSINILSIDRLVDGTLPESERRELLLRMENHPEAWRRCALAFLEDQAWRQALTVMVPVALPIKPVQTKPVRPRRDQLRWALVAATVLVSTFLAGFRAGESIRAIARGETAAKEDIAPSHEPPAPPNNQIRQVGSFDLVEASNGETPPQRFPILSGPGLDDQWLRSQPHSIPEYVKARWERQGYQVAEHRKLMSVLLEDGRQVSIPVDEVEVDYVGQKPL